MSSKEEGNEYFCAIDIGTYNTYCLTGYYSVNEQGNQEITINGIGEILSKGLVKGEVRSIDDVTEGLRQSLAQAYCNKFDMGDAVIVSISGEQVEGRESWGAQRLQNEVTEQDIINVTDVAKAIPEFKNSQIIHALPDLFYVDRKPYRKKPVTVGGVRLEVNSYVVAVSNDGYKNLCKCVNNTGLEIDRVVSSSVASATAVLQDSEAKLGVCVVDIGAGTTDISVYREGALVYVDSINIGGNNFTSDLVVGFRCSETDAEELKRSCGVVLPNEKMKNRKIDIPTAGNRAPRSTKWDVICRIIEERAHELFREIEKSLYVSGFYEQVRNGAGIVLTGGGSEIKNLPEMGAYVMNMAFRYGVPRFQDVFGFDKINGMVSMIQKPSYASVIGSVLYYYSAIDYAVLNSNKKKGGIRKFWDDMCSHFMYVL